MIQTSNDFVLNGLSPEMWMDRAQTFVDNLSEVSDYLWKQFEVVVDRACSRAYDKMIKVISELPNHPNPTYAKMGMVDFSSLLGKRNQRRFAIAMSKIYKSWGDEIYAAMGLTQRPMNFHPWERSLGLVKHPIHRTSIIYSMRRYSVFLLQRLQQLYSPEELTEVSEAVWRLPRIKKGGVRQSLRGALEGTQDQEKAFLENTLRGLDDLRTKHANRIFDAGTGLVHKQALLDIAKDFKAGNISKKQMQLSVQTHLRAMARRESGWFFKSMKKAKAFVQIPPSKIIFATESVRERAYKLAPASQLLKASQGSADSLGFFPGDRVVALPATPAMIERLKGLWEKRRAQYMKSYYEAQRIIRGKK